MIRLESIVATASHQENNDVEGAVVRALNEVNSIQSSPQFERDQTLKELEGAIETTESQLQDALVSLCALMVTIMFDCCLSFFPNRALPHKACMRCSHVLQYILHCTYVQLAVY